MNSSAFLGPDLKRLGLGEKYLGSKRKKIGLGGKFLGIFEIIITLSMEINDFSTEFRKDCVLG